jgi:hypothetical protein
MLGEGTQTPPQPQTHPCSENQRDDRMEKPMKLALFTGYSRAFIAAITLRACSKTLLRLRAATKFASVKKTVDSFFLAQPALIRSF